MRIVYDDTMQDQFVQEICNFVYSLDLGEINSAEWYLRRTKLINLLRIYFESKPFEIGEYDIARDKDITYPVFYYSEKDAEEIQQCGFVRVRYEYRKGIECLVVSFLDYNHKSVGTSYRLYANNVEEVDALATRAPL